MLDPRWRKVLGDLGQHRARSALVALALALGLAAAGTVLATWALVQRATQDGFLASRPASATFSLERVDRLDPLLLDRMRAMPEIAAWRTRRVLQATAQGTGPWRNAVLYAVDDFQSPELGRLSVQGGGLAPPRDGELLIERSSLDYSGLVLGEAGQLRVGTGEPQPIKVTAVLRDVSQAPGWMENLVYLYATPATLARLGVPAGINELQFRVRDPAAGRAEVRRMAAVVQADLEAAGLRVLALDVPEPGQHIHAGQMDSLMLTQGAFGILALLVCALLIVNLFGAVLAGQARQIGVMKALGARAPQLVAMYAVLAGLLGLAASLVALPVAWIAGLSYAAYKADLLNFPFDDIAMPAWPMVLLLAVGLLLPVLAAAWPVRRACTAPVGQLLRDIGIAAAGRSGQGLALRRVLPDRALALLGRPLLLALGNAFRRQRRMALTVLALASGGAVLLGAENLRVAVRASVEVLFAAQHYDLTLRLSPAQPASRLEAMARDVDGVTRAEAWRGKRVTLRTEDGASAERFTLVGLPPGSAQLLPPLLAGRWLMDGDADGLVVGRRLLKDHPDLKPGSLLTLMVDGHPRRLHIVGIVDGGPQPIAYLARSTLDAWAGDTQATTLTVAMDAASRPAQLDLVQRLRAALDGAGMPVASSQLKTESRRVVEDHLVMVVDFLGVMGLVMLVVGGMGLASTMGIAVLERQRELAVMRAIGAPHGTLIWLVQAEGLVVSGLAWLISVPLSVPVAVVLAEAFGRIMFPVPAPWWPDPAGALRWLLVMLATSLVACGWPALRAARLPVASALGYE
ncbi:MAG: ABC transporter permease [Aquabacterium sp.]